MEMRRFGRLMFCTTQKPQFDISAALQTQPVYRCSMFCCALCVIFLPACFFTIPYSMRSVALLTNDYWRLPCACVSFLLSYATYAGPTRSAADSCVSTARLSDQLPAGRSFVCLDLKKIPQILQQIFRSGMLS